MPWRKFELEGRRKYVKLQPSVSVIGFYEGIFPDPKYEGKWNLNMETLGGVSFSVNIGVTIREWLTPREAEYNGRIVLIACTGKSSNFYTYKFGLWDGDASECADDKANQAVIMRTDKLIGM